MLLTNQSGEVQRLYQLTTIVQAHKEHAHKKKCLRPH